jgi:polyribonucleotide nucleotidyltransferase
MVMQVVTDASATDARRGGGGGGGGAHSAYGSGGNTVSVTIPGNKVGLVIGSGGETIRSLESQSGAKIAITQENPGERSYERTINITGNEDAIARAKALIEDVVNPSGGFRVRSQDLLMKYVLNLGLTNSVSYRVGIVTMAVNLDKAEEVVVVVMMTTSVLIAQAPMHMDHQTTLEAEGFAVQGVSVANLVTKTIPLTYLKRLLD